jgi:hypothetical protein
MLESTVEIISPVYVIMEAWEISEANCLLVQLLHH